MAFISKYILDCSVTDNYIENDLMYFYNSLNTIVSKYTSDMNKLSVNEINKKYGHSDLEHIHYYLQNLRY